MALFHRGLPLKNANFLQSAIFFFVKQKSFLHYEI